VVWSFIFELYIRVVLPRAAQVLIPSIVGSAAILWARRRFVSVSALAATERAMQIRCAPPQRMPS
jgi:hypothetical protein